MMRVIMELLLLMAPMTAKRLCLEVWKERFVFGELADKLKLWMALLRSIDSVFLTLKSIPRILKQFLRPMMALASSGILSTILE